MPSRSLSTFYLVDPQSGGIIAADLRGEVAGQVQPLEHVNDLSPGLSETIALHSPGEAFPMVIESIVGGPNAGVPAQIVVNQLRGERGEFLLIEVARPAGQVPPQWAVDAVTGLPDRRALAEHRARWAANPSAPHGVLFLDLEGFKKVNDEHGHAAGDRVLAELAARWRNCIREDDLVVRYGGDEFVVLVEHIGSRADIEPIVRRLEVATRQTFQIGSSSVHVSVTIGVALATDCGAPIEALIAEADRDMYSARVTRKA